ncbi:MAG: hypothetical protein IKE45_10430 [Halomonas sp.]|nr:hypothetical protein [Halomonas sp.]MBR2514415.1 hypothetical protein [Halomonas sp.]
MYKLKENVAKEIFPEDPAYDPKRWLLQEVAGLDSKYSGFENLSLNSILIMSIFLSDGIMPIQGVASKLGISPEETSELIKSLLEYDFAEFFDDKGGYGLTSKGERASRELAANMVTRKRFEGQRRLSHLNRLHDNLDGF